MENSLLLISKGSTFMINALSKWLMDSGIEVTQIEPEIEQLKDFRDSPSVFLFYLGSYIEESRDLLVFLKDMCVEREKILCTIGDAPDYEALVRYIPAPVIKEHFSRPLNVREIAEKMQRIMSLNDDADRKKHILLVDDDPTYLTLIKSWLDEDYRVSIVNSGMQAITFLAKNKPDLILLDYQMPITNGAQVLEMIRSEVETSSIPVIFLTGKGDKKSVTKVLSLKPDGYVLKGVEKEKLVQQISEFFEIRKA